MKMGIRPAEYDLNRVLEIGDRTIAANQQPAPDHWTNLANPDVDPVCFDRFFDHDRKYLAKVWRQPLLCSTLHQGDDVTHRDYLSFRSSRFASAIASGSSSSAERLRCTNRPQAASSIPTAIKRLAAYGSCAGSS